MLECTPGQKINTIKHTKRPVDESSRLAEQTHSPYVLSPVHNNVIQRASDAVRNYHVQANDPEQHYRVIVDSTRVTAKMAAKGLS